VGFLGLSAFTAMVKVEEQGQKYASFTILGQLFWGGLCISFCEKWANAAVG
jgi:hypothetical protein